MQEVVPHVLDPNRVPRTPFSLKARPSLKRITLTLPPTGPGQTLSLSIPKLDPNTVIKPHSTFLRFDLTVAGHANNAVVDNVGRALVERVRITCGGELIQDTSNWGVFMCYHDLFLSSHEREKRLAQGISSHVVRKLRMNAGDKVSSGNEVALAAAHGSKHVIPLEHPILDGHGAFYPHGIKQPLIFEITLSPALNIVTSSDMSKGINYQISNIELQYECIRNETLARIARDNYEMGKSFLYEYVIQHSMSTFADKDTDLITHTLNVPRKSMTGVLILFRADQVPGAVKSEKFDDPKIKSVVIDVDGKPNEFYQQGMVPCDFWQSMNKRMGKEGIGQEEFYSGSKFGIWVDTRTHDDPDAHGSGLRINDTRSGLTLKIRRTKGASSSTINYTCWVFVVSDAVFEVKNQNLKSVIF